MDKQNILKLMKATAAANGGKPLGTRRFEAEAGVSEYHWSKYWPRYNELVIEAGLEANSKTTAYSRVELLDLLVIKIRQLGRFPTVNERRLLGPAEKTFRTHFGGTASMVNAVREYCQCRADCRDVLDLCPLPQQTDNDITADRSPARPAQPDGSVYLMKSGGYYKIGKTNHVGGRERDLKIQLPEPVKTIHSIITDDSNGIEAYWHRRFAGKRKNGEWFELSKEDVAAFRRRKFM